MQITREDLAGLVGLQEHDRLADSLQASIAEVPGRLEALRSESASQKAAVADVKDRLTRLQLKRKEKELEAGQKDEEIRKHSRDLNAVKTNEAYRALESEMGRAKAEKDRIETEIIEILMECDVLAREEKAKAAELKSAEVRIGSAIGEIEARRRDLESQLAARQAERSAAAAQVPAGLVSEYDRIRVRRQGVALARLNGLTCTVCRMNQTPQTEVDLRRGDRLILCGSCQRILYSPELMGAKPA
jgi:predicted  nucleic acid-binding Zn-ribbon protein